MTAEPQRNEPAPTPPPALPPAPPPRTRPVPVPLLLGDEWEAGQPNRRRIAVVAAVIGIALIVSCAVILRSWEPNDERVLAEFPPPAPAALPADSGVPTKRVAGTLSHFDQSEPNDVFEPPPARRRPTARIVARPSRLIGYLSINSSPWAQLSVDGRVVGSTPQVRVRVTPGRHHLLLVREGFQTYSGWVTVPAGGTVRLTDITLAATR